MRKILLIQPPIRDYYRTAKRTIPYGLASIAGSLRAGGFEVEIVDAMATDRSHPVDPPKELDYLREYYGKPDVSPFALFHRFSRFGYSFEHLKKVIVASNADLVGISSLFTAYASDAIETARLVKRALPGAVVVMGGHHATAFSDAVLSSGVVDFVIRGEGEEAMTALATALCGNNLVETVPGIAFRTESGRCYLNPPAVVQALDQLAPPAMDLIRHDYYQRRKRGCTVVMTSRGCPMACAYCCMGKESPFPYRRRDPASVLAEIESAVVHHNTGFIDFEDENLALDKEGFLRLLQGIHSRFKGAALEFRAMNGLYPPSLDHRTLKMMREVGFTTLNLALGTTDPLQLKRFRRPDVRKDFERVVEEGYRLGFSIVAYVIVGTPEQDPLSSVEDLLYLSRMPVLAGVSVFYPAPLSRMHDTCARRSLLPSKTGLYRSTAIPISDTTTRLQTVTLMRLGRMVNFMKRMVSQKAQIPDREVLHEFQILSDLDPIGLGEKLIASFLKDGQIPGVLPQGGVYFHKADPNVVARFLAGFSGDRLRSPV